MTDSNVLRLKRRRHATALVHRNLALITSLLLAAGSLWIVFIPVLPLSRTVYIDENALQPAQVSTHWSWQDVHQADLYLHHLENLRDRNATSAERATFIRDEFVKLGLAAATQDYTFVTPFANVSGVNAYALLSSPRASGSEAIVVSASYRSEVAKEPHNLRGIATVLALANFLKNYSLWAKDIIFVIGDNYFDGTYAWLSAYHGTIPPNLHTDCLKFASGVIWNAFNIDYSGHSFSHLGVFFEGLNGRLPNQDLINSLRLISHYTGNVPLVLYDHLESHSAPQQQTLLAHAPEFMKRSPQIRDLEYRVRNVKRHVGYQARGRPSGAHGLFHRFRIDAITLYAVPADGPHGFFALGRVIESTLRTSNNLLERLHASFFFYIFTTPGTFMKIGMFLPSAVLVGVAMLFWGLRQWVEAGWIQESPSETQKQQDKEGDGKVVNTVARPVWRPRRRPVLLPIVTILATHTFGLLAFTVINTPWFLLNQAVSSCVLFLVFSLVPPAILTCMSPHPSEAAPFSLLLQSFNLCLASIVVSITSLLNFSLAATLAVTLGIPLICSRALILRSSKHLRLVVYAVYWLLAWGWLLLSEQVEKAMWNWQVLGVWFAPFVCIVYAPLFMQAGIVVLSWGR